MRDGVRCPNMNHGRLNPPVKFCPNCGESINPVMGKKCDEVQHRERKKGRSFFCQDCGKKLIP